jgi:hypothetical protein
VPEALHGRAFAAYNAARNTAELGAVGAGGALVSALGPHAALLLASLGLILAAVAGLAALRGPGGATVARCAFKRRADSDGCDLLGLRSAHDLAIERDKLRLCKPRRREAVGIRRADRGVPIAAARRRQRSPPWADGR